MAGQVANLQIVDGLGRLVYSQRSIFSSGALEFPVDVEQLALGAYTVRVSCGMLTGESSFYKK